MQVKNSVPHVNRNDLNIKFIQTLDSEVYETLSIVARQRGVALQELLRAVVIPDWMLMVSREHRRKNRQAAA